MGMIEELFLGVKFSIPGILGGGKIWQVFLGRLDLSWDIFGYTKQSEDFFLCCYFSRFLEIFKSSGMGFFGGFW